MAVVVLATSFQLRSNALRNLSLDLSRIHEFGGQQSPWNKADRLLAASKGLAYTSPKSRARPLTLSVALHHDDGRQAFPFLGLAAGAAH